MSACKFRRLSFVFGLPEASKGARRQSMFDYIKSSIGGIELVQKSKVTTKKTTLSVERKGFSLWIESRPEFILGCIFHKESDTLLASQLMNEVCKRLNETDWKEKSMINMFCMVDFIIDKKYDLFPSFIRKDTWENLFKKEEHYKPRRIEIWQPPNGDRLRWALTIATGKKSNMLEFIQLNVFKDAFPIDAVSKTMLEIQDKKKTFLTKLIGEE